MIDRNDGGRKRWILAAGLVLVLAAGATWVYSRMSARSPDDPQELLRRAGEANGTAALKPVGKPIAVQGKSSSGATVRAELQKVAAKGDRGGFVVHLGGGLKEGDPATLKLPGGGELVITQVKDGEAPPAPPPAKRSAPR